MTDRTALRLSSLFGRVRQIAELDRRYGASGSFGRDLEHEALAWALEELCAAHPEFAEEAQLLADQRSARRALRAAHASVRNSDNHASVRNSDEPLTPKEKIL